MLRRAKPALLLLGSPSRAYMKTLEKIIQFICYVSTN